MRVLRFRLWVISLGLLLIGAGQAKSAVADTFQFSNASVEDGQIVLHLPTDPGVLYLIESTPALGTTAWSVVSETFTGTGQPIEFREPIVNARGFYRARILGDAGTGLLGSYYSDIDLTLPTYEQVDPTIYFPWGSGGPAGMRPDNFSVRWSGQLRAEKSETYTLYALSDDGVRLWLDGQLLIDNWTVHARSEDSTQVPLVAGQKYTLRIEKFEGQGDAQMELRWSSPTTPKAIIPQTVLYPEERVVVGARGWEGQYFYDTTLTNRAAVRTDPLIYFNWGAAAPIAGMYYDYFSIRWRGQILPSYSETYTFSTVTDDGVRLWVDGKQIINSWNATATSTSGTIALQAGRKVDVVMEYFDQTGNANARLLWSSPSTYKEVIPERFVFPPPPLPTGLQVAMQTDGGAALHWSNPVAGESFTVERSLDGIHFTAVAQVAGSSYIDTAVDPGLTYHYRVFATGDTGTSLTTAPVNVQTALTAPTGTWHDSLVKADGTLDSAEYLRLAQTYNSPATIDYRFGPKWSDYYPGNAGTFPTLAQSGSGGWYPSAWPTQNSPSISDWFAMSGQLLYSADVASDPGVARARNGSVYATSAGMYLDWRIQWTPNFGNYYNINPDPALNRQDWKTASGGTIPTPPVAGARSKFMTGIEGVMIFKDGLIGVSGTGNDPNTGNNFYPLVKLPAGKVPTAVAMTLNNEFALVTVWDTATQKGQVAVIAVEGSMVAGLSDYQHLWGIPNWPSVRNLKLLGYVDLPFSAPTSIAASADLSQNNGRDQNANQTADLNSQAERDLWNAGSSQYKQAAKAGYAIVASRAENKVAFIDLQPLYTYYRQMYFTTQANYDQTKNSGLGDTQWPYSFASVPAQVPVVTSVLNVPQPTAVAAGFNRGNAFWWRSTTGAVEDGIFGSRAYVATMPGQLYIYNIGGLNTTAAASAPTLLATPLTGKNPSHIAYGSQALAANPNDLYVTCRGDKQIRRITATGDVISTLTDSRLVDPVSSEISNNNRSVGGGNYLSVMDFSGKQAINYVMVMGTSQWLFGYATPVPGFPFFYYVAEVI